MGQIASNYSVDMVWGLGDNFYESGIRNEFGVYLHLQRPTSYITVTSLSHMS